MTCRRAERTALESGMTTHVAKQEKDVTAIIPVAVQGLAAWIVR